MINKNLEGNPFFSQEESPEKHLMTEVLRHLQQGTLSEDFKITDRIREVHAVTGMFAGGAITFLDELYLGLMSQRIHSSDVLLAGEQVAIIDEQQMLAPWQGYVYVLPYSWHKEILEAYKASGKKPSALLIVAVPWKIIQIENANNSKKPRLGE